MLPVILIALVVLTLYLTSMLMAAHGNLAERDEYIDNLLQLLRDVREEFGSPCNAPGCPATRCAVLADIEDALYATPTDDDDDSVPGLIFVVPQASNYLN